MRRLKGCRRKDFCELRWWGRLVEARIGGVETDTSEVNIIKLDLQSLKWQKRKIVVFTVTFRLHVRIYRFYMPGIKAESRLIFHLI